MTPNVTIDAEGMNPLNRAIAALIAEQLGPRFERLSVRLYRDYEEEIDDGYGLRVDATSGGNSITGRFCYVRSVVFWGNWYAPYPARLSDDALESLPVRRFSSTPIALDDLAAKLGLSDHELTIQPEDEFITVLPDGRRVTMSLFEPHEEGSVPELLITLPCEMAVNVYSANGAAHVLVGSRIDIPLEK